MRRIAAAAVQHTAHKTQQHVWHVCPWMVCHARQHTLLNTFMSSSTSAQRRPPSGLFLSLVLSLHSATNPTMFLCFRGEKVES